MSNLTRDYAHPATNQKLTCMPIVHARELSAWLNVTRLTISNLAKPHQPLIAKFANLVRQYRFSIGWKTLRFPVRLVLLDQVSDRGQASWILRRRVAGPLIGLTVNVLFPRGSKQSLRYQTPLNRRRLPRYLCGGQQRRRGRHGSQGGRGETMLRLLLLLLRLFSRFPRLGRGFG